MNAGLSFLEVADITRNCHEMLPYEGTGTRKSLLWKLPHTRKTRVRPASCKQARSLQTSLPWSNLGVRRQMDFVDSHYTPHQEGRIITFKKWSSPQFLAVWEGRRKDGEPTCLSRPWRYIHMHIGTTYDIHNVIGKCNVIHRICNVEYVAWITHHLDHRKYRLQCMIHFPSHT